MLLVRWIFDRPVDRKGIRLVGAFLMVWFLIWGVLRNLIGL
ncbi:hypothetical protein EVA_12755 [gut metagenome]|uniref:Uncharacterized protein n=1 Tax=gut metagenome TaxID=749906 RepID=J9GI31_9ZZZZ